MEFLEEVVTNRINTWSGILFSVKVNGYLGFKCTFQAQIAPSKIRFQNQMNNREDPDPVRKGTCTGSSVMYAKYVYRENRNSKQHSDFYLLPVFHFWRCQPRWRCSFPMPLSSLSYCCLFFVFTGALSFRSEFPQQYIYIYAYVMNMHRPPRVNPTHLYGECLQH